LNTLHRRHRVVQVMVSQCDTLTDFYVRTQVLNTQGVAHIQVEFHLSWSTPYQQPSWKILDGPTVK
jgi:hypothetical protein